MLKKGQEQKDGIMKGSQLIFRICILSVSLICVIGLIYYLKLKNEGKDLSLLTDRNQYISEFNKRICKYDIVQIEVEPVALSTTTKPSKKTLVLQEGEWIGRGNTPVEVVQKIVDDFCNIRIRNEINLQRLKAPIEWAENIAFIFSDQSKVQAKLSKKGIIQIGQKHYFTAQLLKLVDQL